MSEAKDAIQEKVAAHSEKATSKRDKKEKADKKSAATATKERAKKAESPPKQADDAGDPQPSMIDLRIGKIVEISKHPDADALYVEVRLGPPPYAATVTEFA